MTVADLLTEDERRFLLELVPGVDPRRVTAGWMPAWARRGIGIDPLAVAWPGVIWLSPKAHGLPRRSFLALLAHELTHLQQMQSGLVGFLAAYAVTYLVGRAKGRSHLEAYEAIPAERLARWVQAKALAR
jgi:hypothetical protein